jgi:hypothetical protein
MKRENRRGQESYRLLSRKSGQEEIVGFGLILILVAIIFIVFISSYIRKSSDINNEDYEANSFTQAILQYTTNCEEENLNNLTVQKLIFKCQQKEACFYRHMDPCKVLNDTIKGVARESWKIGPKNPNKGYSLIINVSESEQLLNITEGVVTNNYRTGLQDFGDPHGEYIIILMDVYT